MKLTVLMENTACREDIIAEHGLSLFLKVNGRTLLFDSGRSDRFADNAKTLGVDLTEVDTFILSHGHYDHGGGLKRFLTENQTAKVYLNEAAFAPHYHGGAEGRYIGLDQTLKDSDRLIFTGDETDLGDGLTLSTCNALTPRYPVDSAGLTAERDGIQQPEDFRHEQYLLIHEGGRTILISGCSHKGVLNLVSWFRPDVLIGGFHFMNLDPEQEPDRLRLEEAAKVLRSFPTQYFTCHCTGLKPYQFLKERMGDRLDYLSSGSSLTL